MGTARARPRLRVVDEALDDQLRSAFLRLAERFQPAAVDGIDAVWCVEVVGRGATTVTVQEGRCSVSPGPADAPPDVTLYTDPATWLALVDGRTGGIRAFLEGSLKVKGDLNLAARFETMFRAAPGAATAVETRVTRAQDIPIESFVSGHGGVPVVLLHGLAAHKVSFLPTLDGLASSYEVHALDLPGFGRSGKPLPAGRRYTMAWMADVVHSYLSANGIDAAHVVGNSMGARVATEVALRHPSAVRSTVALGAAVAFEELRAMVPLLRITRPHYLAAAPVRISTAWVETGLRSLFHDPSRLADDNFRAAAEDTVAVSRDHRYRLATATCARALAMEQTSGRRSYWDRLSSCTVPSYWIFGRSDRLVPHRYANQVRKHLPDASVELWDDCGHVPQFELPERTNTTLAQWMERIESS